MASNGIPYQPSGWVEIHPYVGRVLPTWRWTAFRIALTYVLLATVALYASDVLFVRWIDDPTRIRQIQAIKGAGEILVSGALIFGLTRHSHRQIRRSGERVSRANEELQVLHRILRHNLRNDINIISGYAGQLDDETGGTVEEYCRTITERAGNIVEYVEQTETIGSLTTDVEEFELIDLEPTIDDVVDQYRDRADIMLSTVADGTVEATAHPKISMAFDEIIDNAVTHNSREDPIVEIELGQDPGNPTNVEIIVSDNGPGIPAIERRTIEERAETSIIHSDGLGLWIAYWLVSLSDGDLAVAENDPEGTVVTMTLPKY